MALTKVIGNGLGAVAQDGAATFNEGSADVDFRVESNGNTHMLFVQAGSDCLGIKTTSPNDYYADDLVLTAPDEGGMTIVQATGHRGYLAFADGTSGSQAYRGYISYDHNDDTLYLGTDGGGKLLIDTTGAVTKPNQPAFLATPASSQANIPINATTTVAFGTEIFDQNADFNTSDYTFTAPVTGKYQLQYTATYNSPDPATDYVEHILITSNRNYQIVLDPDGFDTSPLYHTFNICVLADMDASDTAYIRIGMNNSGSSQMDISTSSYFSGYLVA